MRRLASVVGFAAFTASVLVIAPAVASVPEGTPVAPGGSVCPGAVGDPGGVAVLNLTPVAATAAGFGAVRASDAPSNNSLGAQAVSNVNFRPGSVDPNVAFASIGADGRVCFDNSPHATIHLVADQMGVMPAAAYEPAAATGATRLVDTRATGAVAPGGSVCPQAVGAPGRVAVVNVTPVEATGPGFGAVRSSDAPSNNSLGAGAVSNVNFSVGSIDPNLAFAVIGGDGRICFDNSPHSAVQLIVDQMGSLPASAFVPAAASGATRLMDTRIGLVVGGIGVTSVVPDAAVCAQAVGEPGDIAVVNGTPVDATGAGFMAARSSDAPSNNTLGDQAVSNWNFSVGSVDPNVAFAEIGPDGMICVDNSNHTTVQMVLDQAGYLPAGQFTPAAATGAARLVDTRRDFIAPPPIGSPTTTTTTTTTTTPGGPTVPSEPVNLVTEDSPGTITLSWSPPESDGGATVDKYSVERSEGDINNWQAIATTTGVGYVDSHLDPATMYFYRVLAHNTVGWGSPSLANGRFPDPPVLPGAIRDAVATPYNATLLVTWDVPADDGGAPIVSYKIEVFDSSDCSGTVDQTLQGLSPVPLGGLVNGELYCIRIRAHTSAGDGVAVDVVGKPGRPTPPEPCSISVYWNSPGDADLNVEWSTPRADGGFPIVDYNVYWYTGDHAFLHSDEGLPPDARYATYQNPGPGVQYYANVVAFNTDGPSQPCETELVSL